MREQHAQIEGYRSSIAAAVRNAVGEKHPRVRARRREVLRQTAELRELYTRVSGEARQEPVDMWLCDNYYVLEKEGKQSAAELARTERRGGAPGMELFQAAVDAVFCQVMPPICDEGIEIFLTELSSHMQLGEGLFSCFPTALKAALIRLSWQACYKSRDDAPMAYAITGFVKLTGLDMEALVGACSGVERILARDPAGIYPAMSEESRQHYRYLISKIARKQHRGEEDVASGILALAECADTPGPSTSHVGYHIIHHPAVTRPRRRRGRISVACQVLVPALLSFGAALWTGHFWMLPLCYLPLWEILRPLIWQASMAGADIDFLPRMDPQKVKNKPKTVVLVSTLLPKAHEAPQLAKRLEQLCFSNSDPDLYYCILADFKECPFPTDEQDDSQLEASRKVIEGLNTRYGPRFMLFLRSRTYNKTQNRYAGWERKRGAITEFIRFLKGQETSVHTFVGDGSVLPDIRYLIALDADTNMLYESAQTMVAVAMHPLNHPVANEKGIVTEGFGILTPKISTDLASAKATAFSRVLSGCGGVTAYETRDKDYYQDLFGESIFAGKGLIHVDSFYECLDQRFPENQILSHDILEGAYLRCGFVSDVEMSDTAPTSMSSWLSRLHRWLRGDWQNIVFLQKRYRAAGTVYENPISRLSKYKLFDNLRRSFGCVVSLLCLILALFVRGPAGTILAVVGILSVCFPSLWAALNALASGGIFTLSRKFFTRTLPHTLELVAQGLFFLIMLPAQAILTADAVARSLWRTLVSRKKMLEWTTAAQADSRKSSFWGAVSKFWLPELFGIGYAILAPGPFLTLTGLVFASLLPVAFYSAKPSAEDSHSLSDKDRDILLSYNAAMWRYFEDFADEKNNFLPPDNMQQSPVYRVANRTSPTNIGLMLLSALAARDMGIIDTGGLYRRIERTLSSVEKLSTWHGNLYNWYDTCTLDTLKPEFVSCVDSGNFIGCLVALKEGLREFVPKISGFAGLITRIEAIIDGCDLTVFYDKRKNLFSIGYDVDSKSLSTSHYDFLMSEARLTSYYAVARKIVGKKHWGSLVRTMSRSGSYAGPVSWTGTMFEYFMPHLLLPVYDGSLLGEALTYCLYCQKKRTKARGIPWGISESAFYTFDNNLNYQYKAHGVQKLGVKRHLDRELVISPYSTFITIPMNPNSSMRNLRRLRELGVYGRYGFYEAVDFTAQRVGKDSLAVTRSYMAHHIGMSMVASVNALFDNKMQERFMSDHYMKSAKEFLQEKITKSTIIYDDLGGAAPPDKEERLKMREESALIFPQSPRCMLLSNGELTDILTDTGAGYLKFGTVDLTRRSEDLLRHPQGFVAVAKAGGHLHPATMAPFYKKDVSYRVEQQEQSVTYHAKAGELSTSLRCTIHPTISCQQRLFTVKNDSTRRETVDVLFYFEPVLSPCADYSAHPAYSKLFVTSEYDPQTRTLIFKRRNRDSTENMFLVAGFLEDMDFTFETRREALMPAPDGLHGLLSQTGARLSGHSGGVPDACMAVSFSLTVPPGGRQSATFLICAARSREEGLESIISMRNLGVLEPKYAAKSPVLMDSLEGRIGGAALSQLLFTTPEQENTADRQRNRLGQSALWCTGISGDMPIALVERPRDMDEPVLHSYIRLHGVLRGFNAEFDLVILCDSNDEAAKLRELVEKLGGGLTVGVRGGIYILIRSQLAGETLSLLRAVTRHFAISKKPPAAQSHKPYRPVHILPSTPAASPVPAELAVYGGVFSGGSFTVDRDGTSSHLPWCHILANGAFGTLVSDRALGYTWAFNSRENKLTPWYNDICADNQGEMCLLREGDRYFDLVNGARATFSKKEALYQGRAGEVESTLRVTISATGCAKYVDVALKNTSTQEKEIQCAFYTEPVLGVNRDTARHICPEAVGRVLLLRNPWNSAVKCFAAITAEGDGTEEAGFMTDRAAFLTGAWDRLGAAPENDPCAAVIIPMKLPPNREQSIRFILSCGRTEASASAMAKKAPQEQIFRENSFEIDTPNQHLNQFINHFAPHQILASRIQGRCAFYQCGGAYGFRDQLQDVMAYLLIDPVLAKRQILRCCSVQFEEGDVLHWWHDLPQDGGGLRGVRTRFADDLLWLPLAVAEYVKKTGDAGVLSLSCRYLSAPELPEGVHEQYIAPDRSPLREDVFSHCVRALERGYRLGENGLPLMGCGDWNDGFSAVGLEGQGTSVWMALFLSATLNAFEQACAVLGKHDYAAICHERAEALRSAVDACAWDGRWYVRAFFDNGAPMGSGREESGGECNIDLLPQAFSVLADMPDKSRVDMGMEHAWKRLYDRELQLVRLFTPAFQHSRQNPGYAKAYPSGIRENGGQYTHSAVWFALALLRQGQNRSTAKTEASGQDYTDRGWEILKMLNPVQRTADRALAEQYKLEPYYMAADIYTNPHASGRGGWSMYTGAASWYYRVVLEDLLGLQIQGETVHFAPALPSEWPSAGLSATINGTTLNVTISRDGEPGVFCDGAAVESVALDGGVHNIKVVCKNIP